MCTQYLYVSVQQKKVETKLMHKVPKWEKRSLMVEEYDIYGIYLYREWFYEIWSC